MHCLWLIIVGKEPVVITLFGALSETETIRSRARGVVSPNIVNVDVAPK